MDRPAVVVPYEPSNWEIFKQVMRMCGQCCYVLCPPVPELVTRKLAFHPPLRGQTYKVVLKDGTEAKTAKDLVGQDFRVQLTNEIRPIRPEEHEELMETVETFVTTTAYHNHIVGIKISPANGSSRSSQHYFSPRNGVEQVILFSQPNSSDIGHLLHPAAAVFQRMADDLGVDVYAYDYSGYGFSTGRASERNIYADVQAVYEHIRKIRPNVRIVLVGFSIGTTASVHLAAQKPPKLAGVVLLAAFFSGISLLRQQKDPKKADDFCDRFRNIDRINEISAPVLLIHGADDELVPVEHSQEMYKMLQRPVAPLFVYGANHATILSHPFTNLRLIRFLLNETDIGPLLLTNSRS